MTKRLLIAGSLQVVGSLVYQRIRRKFPACDPAICDLNEPIFGICYGMQMMSHQLNGKVERAGKREYGKAEVEFVEGSTSPMDWTRSKRCG